jgi:hypothetical protein
MGDYGRGLFPPTQTFENWEAFTRFLKEKFLPRHLDYQLLFEMEHYRMSNNDFPAYHAVFTSYRENLTQVDDTTLRFLFIQGLEPQLQAKLLRKQPETFQEAVDLAWTTYRTLPPPGMYAMASNPSAVPRATPTPMEMDAMKHVRNHDFASQQQPPLVN